MKFKLDENFGSRTIDLFRAGGHDVETVHGENLSGCADQELIQICLHESRCLITLDLDFTDVIRFPPQRSAGIAVIRVPRNPSLALLEKLVSALLNALKSASLARQLWIVEIGRIRVHDRPAEDDL